MGYPSGPEFVNLSDRPNTTNGANLMVGATDRQIATANPRGDAGGQVDRADSARKKDKAWSSSSRAAFNWTCFTGMDCQGPKWVEPITHTSVGR